MGKAQRRPVGDGRIGEARKVCVFHFPWSCLKLLRLVGTFFPFSLFFPERSGREEISEGSIRLFRLGWGWGSREEMWIGGERESSQAAGRSTSSPCPGRGKEETKPRRGREAKEGFPGSGCERLTPTTSPPTQPHPTPGIQFWEIPTFKLLKMVVEEEFEVPKTSWPFQTLQFLPQLPHT